MSKRDPRVDPRPGDVLDDDPPAPPLIVWKCNKKDVIGAARYWCDKHGAVSPCCDCPTEVSKCTFSGTWNIDDWRDEMKDSVVLLVCEDPSET